MCGGDKLKTGGRSGAIDMVRVLAMLSIVRLHSEIKEPIWDIWSFFFGAGGAVVFFFFCAALFLKPDALAIYKRAGWLFACYVFWGVMSYWVLLPVMVYITQCIRGSDCCLSFPSLMSIPFQKIIQWDFTKVYPQNGVLWFLRLLLLLTLVSPLLMKLPRWVLLVMGVGVWGVRYTELVTSPEYQEWLPFFLTSRWIAASVSAYLVGMVLWKSGGIKLIVEYGHRLYLVAAVICIARFASIFIEYRGILIDDMEILIPFSLCSLLLILERYQIVRRIGGIASYVAPGIFMVYILHSFFNRIMYTAGQEWFEGFAFRGYCILMPVLVFVLCWLIYQVLVRIPHCSMLLCFVSRRKR